MSAIAHSWQNSKFSFGPWLGMRRRGMGDSFVRGLQFFDTFLFCVLVTIIEVRNLKSVLLTEAGS